MATMKFYLDRRFPGKDGACPLKIAVGTPKETAYINTRIKLMPEHWDNETQRVLGRSDRVFVNRALVKMFDKAYEDLEKIVRTTKGRSMGAKELRDALEGKMGDRAEGVRTALPGGWCPLPSVTRRGRATCTSTPFRG